MALDAFGSLFQVGIGTATTLASVITVGEVRNINGPTYGRTMLETSNMDSTSQARTYIYGMADHGEMSIDILYTPTSTAHQELTDAITNKDVKTFRIAWGGTTATTSSWSGTALVKGFQPTASYDGLLAANVSLQVTGVLTVPT
jgi:hypothetical protein